MVDVRRDVLRPPHGTTPAAVKSNKIQKCLSAGCHAISARGTAMEIS